MAQWSAVVPWLPHFVSLAIFGLVYWRLVVFCSAYMSFLAGIMTFGTNKKGVNCHKEKASLLIAAVAFVIALCMFCILRVIVRRSS